MFGKKATCYHAGLADHRDEYLFDVSGDYLKEHNFKEDILVTGHTHLPSYKKFYNSQAWLNPGSVGQPRDGDNRASYVVISENLNIEFVRLSYNSRIIVEEMKKQGFEDYISAPLLTGQKIGL